MSDDTTNPVRRDGADTRPASGRFLIRMESGLHTALREAARATETSLNDYCVRKLAVPAGGTLDGAAQTVKQASAIAGKSLVGVMVFGSWARGTATDASDVDVLIVVDTDLPITRELYREWDAAPLSWENRPIEPHFVGLAESDGRISGLWAEVATGGLVLYERGFEMSRVLAELRGRIANGEVVRRWSNGHPYWVATSSENN